MTAPAHSSGEYRLLHFSVYVALFCVGLYAAAFGPALPFIAQDLRVSLDTAGLILTAMFIGSIAAAGAVAFALHGADTRVLCLAGLLSITAGLLLLGFAPSWEVALLGAVVLGVGDGLVVAASHVLMSLTSANVAGAINRINVYFALGAVAGPIWAGAILARTSERWIVYTGIAGFAVVALALMLVADIAVHHPLSSPANRVRLAGNPTVWIMGAVLFLYVGAEFGLGSWVSSYTRETAGAGVFASALLAAGYWGALALGRILSGVYFARPRDASTLLLAAVAAGGIAALALALSSGNLVVASIAAFGAGLSFGPIWPAAVAISSDGAVANATAATVMMGGAGGLVIPWLQGKVLVGAGPGEGVAVTAALCLAMFVIVLFFRARKPSMGQPASAK